MPRFALSIPGFSRLLGRGNSGEGSASEIPEPEDPLLEVGRRLKSEREARGLNLRQMALETKISTPVLEALERGWRDRLPEGAYLKSMLPLLEEYLNLPGGSLSAALPAESESATTPGMVQRFTPGSIDVFSSWQGTVLYGAITLGLIYGLNLQQRQLAAANLLTYQPIPALKPSEQAKPVQAGNSLLAAYPDLKPLERAKQGSGAAALRQQLQDPKQQGQGVLELNLSQASALDLSSEGGQRTRLSGSKGQVVLQLQPPLKLSIAPAPKTGEVLWNGKPLAALPKQPERFQVPAPQAQRP